jgi:acetylornithine aminotransferase
LAQISDAQKRAEMGIKMNILNTSGYEMYQSNMTKGEDCFVIDHNGKKYLDFESGVWALPLGHNNQRINTTITNQLNQLVHVGYRYSHPVVEEAAKALMQIMNLEGGKCLFLSSGSEAVEFSLKIVKRITDKPYLLSLDKHYLSAYGVSGDTTSDNWITIDWQSCVTEKHNNYETFLEDIPFDKICAFVFEPGNASGTAKLPPTELITRLASKVKEHNGWIVIDEVTTGMGRTGKWFGYENFDIKPDLIACGKGLGNGYPVSAVGISEEVATLLKQTNFTYAQSHQNDPLGCAVAKEVITIMNDDFLLEKSLEKGMYLKDAMMKLSDKHKIVKEVRGIGLMCAMEFDDSISATGLCDIHRKLFDAGFIVGIKPAANTMRFYPPLTIEKYMIDDMIRALDIILLEEK